MTAGHNIGNKGEGRFAWPGGRGAYRYFDLSTTFIPYINNEWSLN